MDLVEKSLSSAKKLRQLKEEIKQSIVNQSFQLPLFTFNKQFSFNSLKYQNIKKGQMMVNLNTVVTLTRILEIIEIALASIEKGEYITKRNLYYKLVHYYKQYQLVDTDIQLITFNINVSREDLHILSSSRCLILGNLTLKVDQSEQKCTCSMITNVANFGVLKGIDTQCKCLFIIEKESALHQINQKLITFFCKKQQPSWFKQTIFITAKGYPDNTCRGIVDLLAKKVQKIYYLGDQDIFGGDILLSYAIGNNIFSTILHKIHWIQLSSLIFHKDLEFQYQIINKEDKKKYIEIFNRNYIKDIDDFIPKNQLEEKVKASIIDWKRRVKRMKESNKKIQLQSLFEFLPENWIENLLNRQ